MLLIQLPDAYKGALQMEFLLHGWASSLHGGVWALGKHHSFGVKHPHSLTLQFQHPWSDSQRSKQKFHSSFSLSGRTV